MIILVANGITVFVLPDFSMRSLKRHPNTSPILVFTAVCDYETETSITYNVARVIWPLFGK